MNQPECQPKSKPCTKNDLLDRELWIRPNSGYLRSLDILGTKRELASVLRVCPKLRCHPEVTCDQTNLDQSILWSNWKSLETPRAVGLRSKLSLIRPFQTEMTSDQTIRRPKWPQIILFCVRTKSQTVIFGVETHCMRSTLVRSEVTSGWVLNLGLAWMWSEISSAWMVWSEVILNVTHSVIDKGPKLIRYAFAHLWNSSTTVKNQIYYKIGFKSFESCTFYWVIESKLCTISRKLSHFKHRWGGGWWSYWLFVTEMLGRCVSLASRDYSFNIKK